MKKKLAILLMILIFSVTLRAQSVNGTTGFWKLYSYSGELRFNGFYRQQERKGNQGQIDEIQKSVLLSPGILLQTKNYIWSPKFLMIDIDGEYSPVKSNEKFLVIPEQRENMNINKFDARIILFPQNKFSVVSYVNYGRMYNNREFISPLKAISKNWGSTIHYRIKKIPFSIGYTSWKQDEEEIQTGRKFQNRQNNFEGRVSTSFRKTDNQELVVSHNQFFRKDFSKSEVFNNITNVNYNNSTFFGTGKKINLSTFLTGTWQKGLETFTRYQAIENSNWEINKSLRSGANYTFFAEQRPLHSMYQHRTGVNLRHQLFQSLQSQIAYDYASTTNSVFREQFLISTLDLRYSKKLLKKHNLDISYRYNLQAQKWNSQDGFITVINEVVTLKDGQLTLLARPYITATGIRVKDATGTIIYQLNFDYILITQNNHIQIQRMPGGQIANNTTVYVDYTAVQPGSYQYTSTNYLFSAELSFFNRMFGIYYRKSVQDYDRLKKTDFLILNYFDQQVVGFKLDYKDLSGGFEYDNMNSTVLPYKLFRYYVNLNRTINSKMMVSVNGNLYDYKMLNNIENFQFFDVSGTAAYHFTPKVSWINSVTYQKQNGEGVDLNLASFKSEMNVTVHKLFFSVFYNYYDRSIFDERIRFNSVNVRIARKF